MDWNDLFPDMTPEQAKVKLEADANKLEEWKGHSRTWENRSKENHTALEAAQAELEAAKAAVGEGAVDAVTAEQLKQRAKAAEDELSLTRKLSVMGVDSTSLMDSKSFMDDVSALDPEAEDYEKDFTALVESRTKGTGGPFVGHHLPGVRRELSGGDMPKKTLWDEVHGDKQANTL